jgi:aldehyde dehydrogenase (NAD+)/phenylacetaldehyde dehydrogenase
MTRPASIEPPPLPPSLLWIDNEAVPAQSGATFTTEDPATGLPLATLARGGRADVERAVASAKAAQRRWAAVDPNEKQRTLWKIGEAVMAHLDRLAWLEAVDCGKPLANARAIDVPRTADTFFYFAGWATKLTGDTVPVRGPFLNYTVREPLGVVGAIIPWNFPLLLAARKIAPAAGLPPGLLNVVTGVGEEAGAALVEHPDVAKISFTGGTVTGKHIMRAAAGTLKKLSLELGGKSANIIFADADLPAAAAAAVSAIFYNQGELCTAGSRLLVERSALPTVLPLVVEGARRLRPEAPLSPGCALGPLVSAEHHARVLAYIEKGLAEGARLETGGGLPGPGYYVEPTVFSGVDASMTIAREEIFGPVLSVITFDSLEEAAALADATEFGLAAGVWTRDIGKAHALAARLKAGTVWINTYNRFDAAMPYGGVKQSGFGRENGRAVLDEYTQLKSVWVALG